MHPLPASPAPAGNEVAASRVDDAALVPVAGRPVPRRETLVMAFTPRAPRRVLLLAAALLVHTPVAAEPPIAEPPTAAPLVAAPAAPEACAVHLLGGRPPALVNPKLGVRTRALCFTGYAILHSGVTRTPLWAAEHLTRARVEAARDGIRTNAFHPDPGLPEDERAELADYARSGFDRGHMAPFGDMPDATSQEESFSLANVVPQDPDDNRRLWAAVEGAVRDLALADGEVYVVTGPIFAGDSLEALRGRVLVPTELFKAVYDPARRGAAAYVVRNAAGGEARVVAMDELARLAGLDPFPTLPPAVKATALALPEPRERLPRRDPDRTASTSHHDSTRGGSASGAWWPTVRAILRALDRLVKS